jgi:ankyrin repeat protein
MCLNRFRWVFCQLEALRPCFPNNLRRMLEELPRSLDETYQRILKEINNANQKEAHQLLQCLAVARRPLGVEELAEVLALDVDAGGIPRFNAKWRWEDHEAAVLSACSSLVSVIIDHGSRVVQFSHFSVKEFLTSGRLASMEDVSQFHIADEPSHTILAQACLGVLLSVDKRTSEDSVEDIPLLPYADEYWTEHVQVGNVELRIKDALDCLFDLDKPHFEALVYRTGFVSKLRYFRAGEDPKGVVTAAAPFTFALEYELNGVAERLIVANQLQVIGCRFHGWTLLHSAVYDNKIEGARLLLAHGADINSRKDYRTPPHITSVQSHFEGPVEGTFDEIENSQQNSDTDVSSEESIDEDMGYGKESGFTPLHIAVSKGYLDMCKMLLEQKADVCAHDNSGNTPLHLAASGDHLEISRILLKYNADINSQTHHRSTPLLLASEHGTSDLVQLLLDHNADVHVCDADGDTPLHCAAIEGQLEVARLLLKLDIEVNSRNNDGSTPLHLASAGYWRGNPDIVRLLLDHGADAQARNLSGKSASEVACGPNEQEIVQLLTQNVAK